jgi:hypothetical protein
MPIVKVKKNLVGFHIDDVDFLHILAVLATGFRRESQSLHSGHYGRPSTETTTVGNGITDFDGFHTNILSGFQVCQVAIIQVLDIPCHTPLKGCE